MAGITTQVIVTPSGGTSSVIIQEQGNDITSVSDLYVHKPGVGTFTYAVQCKSVDITTAVLPRSRRRVLVVIRFRK